MTKDEALKMAIEALERYGDAYGGTDGDFEALKACEEALEQPSIAELNDEYLRDTHVEGLEQPAQEPVAYIKDVGDKGIIDFAMITEEGAYPVYTHPAPLQNEFAKTTSWQGLSDSEILIICAKMAAKLPNKKIDLIFARAIEAKLKEKNT